MNYCRNILTATLSSIAIMASAEPTQAALDCLREQLYRGPAWTRVHAAEGLFGIGLNRAEITTVFMAELAQAPADSGYQAGCLRILSQCGTESTAQRAKYLQQLKMIAAKPQAPGVTHAVEALAKLSIQLSPTEQQCIRQYATGTNRLLAAYAIWLLAIQSQPVEESSLRKLLKRECVKEERETSAYATSFLLEITPAMHSLLLSIAADRTESPTLRILALRGIFRHEEPTEEQRRWLLQILQQQSPAATVLRWCILTQSEYDRSITAEKLGLYLQDPDPEIRCAAATGILNISSKRNKD